MKKTIALVLALAFAAPLAAVAATPANQANGNFSQGRHAEMLNVQQNGVDQLTGPGA